MWVWLWENWATDNIGCKSLNSSLQSWLLQSLQANTCHFHGKARWALMAIWCSSLPATWERAVPVLGRKQPGHLQTLIMTFIFYLGKLCPCYTQMSSCWSLQATQITAVSQPENTAQPQQYPAQAAASITPPGTTTPCSGSVLASEFPDA